MFIKFTALFVLALAVSTSFAEEKVSAATVEAVESGIDESNKALKKADEKAKAQASEIERLKAIEAAAKNRPAEAPAGATGVQPAVVVLPTQQVEQLVSVVSPATPQTLKVLTPLTPEDNKAGGKKPQPWDLFAKAAGELLIYVPQQTGLPVWKPVIPGVVCRSAQCTAGVKIRFLTGSPDYKWEVMP